jgi:NAD(P)-dependent dehydrogenase (short-subunit alcohol dehydrogenase family)
MSEQQRVAIMTGAAGGIGRELVLGLLGKGLKVAAVDRTVQGLAEFTQAVQQRQQAANLMTIEADLARDGSIDEIISKACGRFGVIDILVNNAGVGQATIRNALLQGVIAVALEHELRRAPNVDLGYHAAKTARYYVANAPEDSERYALRGVGILWTATAKRNCPHLQPDMSERATRSIA